MLKKVLKITGISLGVMAVIIGGNLVLPVDQAAITVAAEPIFNVPTSLTNPVTITISGRSFTVIPTALTITNAFFTSVILSFIIIGLAFYVGRRLKEKPGVLQNIVEFVIEALDGLVTSIAPKKWAATFFPILATIFIYLLFTNWFGLLAPFLGSFGFVHPAEKGGIPVENVMFITGSPATLHQAAGENTAKETATHETPSQSETLESGKKVMLVPLFRAPSSDLNLTLSLALVTMVLVQVFGFREHGFKYLGHFIRIKSFAQKGFGMGLIDFLVGLIELVSEFFKIISFTFRLFGNIFAGEVVLIVILSLVSLLLILVFFGLEIFVGLIQAFVFFILSLVFFSIATQSHEEEH